MEKINGAMLSQVAVALVAMDFDDELSKEWIKYIGSSEDLPTIKNFVAFATPLTQNLPNKKPSPPQLLPNLKALFPNLKANLKKKSHPLG